MSQPPQKWKSPYTTKTSETSIKNLNRVVYAHHNWYYFRVYKQLTTPIFKTQLELELSKFVYEKPRVINPRIFMAVGAVAGLLLYIYDTKAREINQDMADPGKLILYRYKPYTIFRELRFHGWALWETNAAILLKNPKSQISSAENFLIEPAKKEWLLALQAANYEKRRSRKFDFLSVGEPTIYSLI
jgi:hypothetical protein